MRYDTHLAITLILDEGECIFDAISGLPEYCRTSFIEISPSTWSGQFIVTCPVAPELAEGDFETDLAPHFPLLLNLKTFYSASFEMNVVVGFPGPTSFILAAHSVSMLSALGAKLILSKNTAE